MDSLAAPRLRGLRATLVIPSAGRATARSTNVVFDKTSRFGEDAETSTRVVRSPEYALD